MKNEMLTGAIGTALSAAGTASQTNETLQTISLIITIVGGVITFIVVPLWNFLKRAKQDGVITKDEIKEGVDIVQHGVDQLNDHLNKKEDEKK